MRALAILLALAACRGDTPNEERRLPLLHPGPFEIPGDLRIPVTVDTTPVGAIDAQRLSLRGADFKDEDRHAWRLDRLLAAELRTGRARISGVHETGTSLVVELPGKQQVPVLLVNRRGQALITLVDPADPFPKFHGQGGRLSRPGQPNLQAVVSKIEIETLP
jgi:hypothetical protein